MFAPTLLIMALFCYNNAKRARLKNLNPNAWGFYTAISFIAGIILACFVLMLIILYKTPSLATLAQTNDKVRMNQFLEANFNENALNYSALIIAGAFGGHLFIRYLIEKKKIAA
jgi:hypothetical protein